MADGVAITPGSGATIATDDCGAPGHAQIIKLGVSANGDATPVPADATYGVASDVKRLATWTISGDTTLQSAANASGNGSSMTVTGYGTAIFLVTGSFVADVEIQGSMNGGTTWHTVLVSKSGSTDLQTSITQQGAYRAIITGFDLVRAVVTWTSGTSVTVVGRATNATYTTRTVQLSSGTNTIGNVGVTGDALTSLQLLDDTVFAEDTAHASGDKGHLVLAVRNSAHAALTSTDGDYSPIAVDAEGCVYVVGEIAHDAADSGNPIKVGSKAESSPATATMVADGDRTEQYADIDGIQMTKPFTAYGDILVERVTNTDGAATALTTFGATASARNMITTIAVYNDSATNGYIDFRDGTGGSVIFTLPIPAKGGAICNFPLPLRQPTANTALAFDASAAMTTLYISLVGFKSKV